MLNTNYGKLVDGYPQYLRLPIRLTLPITIGGVTHPAGAHLSTNDDTAIKELGYKPVTRSPMPSREGYYYTEMWEDNGAEIVQSWTEHEAQATTQDYIDALAELGVNVNDAS